MPVSVLTSSPEGLSLAHMAWATAMAMVRDCLISAQVTSFLSPIPGLSTSPSTKPPRPRNGNCSRPGHIVDYILVNRRFRSSILNTCVYRSVLHESDHELVVSTLRFKIKTKRRQSTVPHRQTTNLHADIKSDFRTHLSAVFSHIFNDTSIESSWSAFKSAINSACTVLPEVLSSHDPDWVTDELRNLSQKKSNAWLSYRDAAERGYEVESHREEYKLLCKLTKEAAEKARNAWWTARAVQAERRAWVAEQLGHGGSLIKELRLLKNRFTKPSSSTLTTLDGSPSQLTQPSLRDG